MIISLYVILLIALYIALSVSVIKHRIRAQSALGDAGDVELQQRIRAHGNFAEYVPLFVIAMALAEMQGLNGYAVNFICTWFVIGRFCHAHSFLNVEKFEGKALKTSMKFRQAGMMLTFSGLGLAALALALAFASAQGIL